ncbi:hypothetical protein BKA67DRAFT_217558 [Truncatella angustata]|uniref:Uncharacterized protein n=1 Tax=Truncatella angustata TaxID=152316 RepID=A0A9P8UUR2_9PEZI|nr:uncharacterized protein BKA67DRAFT_217558 [Truncatella angustata]KAH6658583.1 hypothetical protein BKA67DRAFT_217558 [Truncatella angustata]
MAAQMLSLAYTGNGKDHDVLLFPNILSSNGHADGSSEVDEKTAASKLAKVPEDMMHTYAFAA